MATASGAEVVRCAACQVETDRIILTLPALTCSVCGRTFCGAHAFLHGEFEQHGSSSPAVKDSCLCVACLATIWEEPDGPPRSIGGVLKRAWLATRRLFTGDPKKKLTLRPGVLEAWLGRKTTTVLKHDRDVTLAYVMDDLAEFARVYAREQGRGGLTDLNLKDLYRLIDWVREHPAIPSFVHEVRWSSVETTSAGMGLVLDAFRVLLAVKSSGSLLVAFSANSAVETAYLTGTLASQEVTGKSLAGHLYDSVFAKAGLNLNPKRAFVHWLAGRLVVELYRRPAAA
jgi:hypothetical protein